MLKFFSLIFLILASCTSGDRPLRQSAMTAPELIPHENFYLDEVQPIFNTRCVACHACYNSPCQLNLTSFEGLSRGGNKQEVYDFPTFIARKPTRLYVDAHTEADWRKRDFYSVLYQEDKYESVLNYILGTPEGIESKKQNAYESESSRSCMKSLEGSERDDFHDTNSAGRMPFGLPALEVKKQMTLRLWQDLGSKGPRTHDLEAKVLIREKIAEQVKAWETFMNGESMKSRLSARYIYEHLFLAHIYFPGQAKVFFRMVRSKTRNGSVDEIASSYPFDDPKQAFYYRLRPVTNTIAHKTHIPFLLSPEKMTTWQKSFLDSSWGKVPTIFPPYGREAANPFKTFGDIPVKARYQFMLDEAGYHVMTFIKGPVCRGQTALNVINDHFWVLFVDPEKDPLVQSRELYQDVTRDMILPASQKGELAPFADSREKYWQGVGKKYDFFKTSKTKLDTSWIWNGDKTNTNAALTIYRHFDSANVVRGFRGESPKTIWLMDYHVFETVYYNLAAGYNVFGPIAHQLNSRLFMEVSRIASEDLFITLLAPEVRVATREAWSQPAPSKDETIVKWLADIVTPSTAEKMKYEFRFYGEETESAVPADKNSSKDKLMTHLIRSRFSRKQTDYKGDFYVSANALRKPSQSMNGMTALLKVGPQAIQHLPDAILMRVRAPKKSQLYTLIHNKSHYNVSQLMFEQQRRNPEKDSIDILSGVAASYANLFLDVTEPQLLALAKQLLQAKTKDQVFGALHPFVVSRNDPNFWEIYEWFSKRSDDKITKESGWLDLNRYSNFR